MRKQIADPHPIGVSDIIEPISQLIGDFGQLITGLTHSRQESIASGHARSLIDDVAPSNGWTGGGTVAIVT